MTVPSDAEVWRRINDLFHQALDVPSSERAAFLERACAGEPPIAREVQSLLDAHARAADFIEAPVAPREELDAIARSMPVAGRQVGSYRLLRVLGEGGMGVVYLAHDTRLDRPVALKAVAPRFASDSDRSARLTREARAAAALAHQGIATVYALEEIAGDIYIAAEYVPGHTLREALATGPMHPVEVLDIVRQVAAALAAAHRVGIIHRDLKPENVIRTPDGTVKILDFGLAQFSAPDGVSSLTSGGMPGTPAYMSPEQIRGGVVDRRSDLFALGGMVVELLTGTHPFHADTQAATIARVLEHEPQFGPTLLLPQTSLDERNGRAAPGLMEIARTLLNKNPGARYQTAEEVVRALDALAPHAAPTPHPVSNSNDVPAVATRARWWWQFHEVTATTAYVVLLAPLWHAREFASRDWGILLFLAGLVAVIVAGALRLHLCFAAHHYPGQWSRQHSRARTWIRTADAVLTVTLLIVGLLAVRADAGSGVLLVAAAAAVAVSAVVIEPATTNAAFDTD
ncbi:MAG: serine/threonine-protein kinase [Vicinamibacterales bacterium]